MNEYRVWDGEKMHYWDDGGMSLIISGGEWGLYRNVVGDIYPICIASSKQKNSDLMWGTGLRDKNGRVIYKGDDFTAKHKSGKVYKGQVKHGLSFIFDIADFEEVYISGVGDCKRNRQFDIHSFIQWFEEIEIVGGVYQNPELSEGME